MAGQILNRCLRPAKVIVYSRKNKNKCFISKAIERILKQLTLLFNNIPYQQPATLRSRSEYQPILAPAAAQKNIFLLPNDLAGNASFWAYPTN